MSVEPAKPLVFDNNDTSRPIVCAITVCTLYCFAFALLCFMLLSALPAFWFFLAYIRLMTVALTIKALFDLAMRDVFFRFVVSMLDIYPISYAIICFSRIFPEDND